MIAEYQLIHRKKMQTPFRNALAGKAAVLKNDGTA